MVSRSDDAQHGYMSGLNEEGKGENSSSDGDTISSLPLLKKR